MTKPFWQARCKLGWADQHMAQLNVAWQRYLETDFCEIRMEDDFNFRAEPGGPPHPMKIVKVWAKPLPVGIALGIGDTIHNIHSALDYAINEILHWKSGRIGFPVHESREQLEDSFRTDPVVVAGKTKKAGGNADIARAVEGISDFILNEVKPYKGGNDFLWAIARLDNTDKHRMLTFMAAPHAVHDVKLGDGKKSSFTLASATVSAGGIMNAVALPPHFKVESYGRISAQILFAEVGVVEGQPVLPTLVNMLKRAAEAIDAIEAFVIGKGWEPPENLASRPVTPGSY